MPTMNIGSIDPQTELGSVLAAYELTLSALITTSAQCRTLFDELFTGQAQLVWLLQQIRKREQELAEHEAIHPTYQENIQ